MGVFSILPILIPFVSGDLRLTSRLRGDLAPSSGWAPARRFRLDSSISLAQVRVSSSNSSSLSVPGITAPLNVTEGGSVSVLSDWAYCTCQADGVNGTLVYSERKWPETSSVPKIDVSIPPAQVEAPPAPVVDITVAPTEEMVTITVAPKTVEETTSTAPPSSHGAIVEETPTKAHKVEESTTDGPMVEATTEASPQVEGTTEAPKVGETTTLAPEASVESSSSNKEEPSTEAPAGEKTTRAPESIEETTTEAPVADEVKTTEQPSVEESSETTTEAVQDETAPTEAPRNNEPVPNETPESPVIEETANAPANAETAPAPVVEEPANAESSATAAVSAEGTAPSDVAASFLQISVGTRRVMIARSEECECTNPWDNFTDPTSSAFCTENNGVTICLVKVKDSASTLTPEQSRNQAMELLAQVDAEFMAKNPQVFTG